MGTLTIVQFKAADMPTMVAGFPEFTAVDEGSNSFLGTVAEDSDGARMDLRILPSLELQAPVFGTDEQGEMIVVTPGVYESDIRVEVVCSTVQAARYATHPLKV
ncbi:MAG: hypothetical protein OXR68_04255 [Alphaproteobacteria bacterium]|nr:hypothetical protein [Alphaproteobacteria bacterium]MDD9919820.1 hypothetical protein [Alphaproteobacteria bacterium]